MKYDKLGEFSFLLDENHFVYDKRESDKSIDIYVKSQPHGGACPVCGEESRKLHSTYNRTIQDTPIHCKQTILHLKAYKYECHNPECACKVFMEALPFAQPRQVRTDKLTSMILWISMFLSNEGASKVLELLGVKISNDSIQRIYDRIEFSDDPNAEAIGVDDVAIRKGQTYATAIYDLNDHHFIALLEGRDGQPLKEWLKNHRKVNLVARDRASAYASAISEILPDCIQVADRFHLLQNLLDRLKDVFKEEMPAEIFIRNGEVLNIAPEKIPMEKKADEKRLTSFNYDNSVPMNTDGTETVFDNKKHHLNSSAYQAHAESRKKNKN